MTNEKMLELLNEYISKMEKEELGLIETVEKNGNFNIKSCFRAAALAELRHGLLENIRKESAKSAGRLSALKAEQRILKGSQIGKAWIGADNRQYFCSGYHMVALKTPLEVENGKANTSAEKLLTSCENDGNFTLELKLPSVSELKAHIKTEKANPARNKKIPVSYDFGASLPLVNAQYLADILECLPECVCRIDASKGSKSNLIFGSESGAGILCPVYKA